MPPNNRLGSRKARSGCLTCKKRKVKCDEAKPKCGRCLQSRRQCEGYDIFTPGESPQALSHSTNKPNSNPGYLLSRFKATEAEWRAYDFYFHRASLSIGGALDIEFWQGSVLRFAESQVAIRYAIFALGNLARHDSECPSTEDIGCSCRHYRSALRYYIKAVVSLKDQIESDQQYDVPVLACALFTCMESILGNNENAVSLIDRGHSMLQRHNRDVYLSGGPLTSMPSLIAMFVRLRLLALLFGHPVGTANEQSSHFISDMDHGNSPSEIRQSLFIVMNDSLDFVREATGSKWFLYSGSEDLLDLYRQQYDLTKRLDQWHNHFLLNSKDDNWCLETVSILDVYYTVTKIWLATALSFTEKIYAGQLDNFRRIVHLATNHLSTTVPPHSPAPSSTFSFEMGWIPPLYFTTIKCRNPHLRAQALRLLSLAPRREGIWDRAVAITVAKRAIELETTKYKGDMLFFNIIIGQCSKTGGTGKGEGGGKKREGWKVAVTFMWPMHNHAVLGTKMEFLDVERGLAP